MSRFATLVCALVVSGAVAAVGTHAAAPRLPDFSGRWRLAIETRPITGGPTAALFGLKLRPPEQVDTPPLTRTGERPANGSVSFQGVIGADRFVAHALEREHRRERRGWVRQRDLESHRGSLSAF